MKTENKKKMEIELFKERGEKIETKKKKKAEINKQKNKEKVLK